MASTASGVGLVVITTPLSVNVSLSLVGLENQTMAHLHLAGSGLWGVCHRTTVTVAVAVFRRVVSPYVRGGRRGHVCRWVSAAGGWLFELLCIAGAMCVAFGWLQLPAPTGA